jgi:hypothetical protein
MDGQSNAAGELLPALEQLFQPWELVGESRRDCRSHRAGLLLAMARLSLLLGGLSLLCPPLGLIGLPLALIIRRMARRDLDAMFAGDMDQRGRQRTEKAWSDSLAAAFIYLIGCLICGGVLAVLHVLSQSPFG